MSYPTFILLLLLELTFFVEFQLKAVDSHLQILGIGSLIYLICYLSKQGDLAVFATPRQIYLHVYPTIGLLALFLILKTMR